MAQTVDSGSVVTFSSTAAACESYSSLLVAGARGDLGALAAWPCQVAGHLRSDPALPKLEWAVERGLSRPDGAASSTMADSVRGSRRFVPGASASGERRGCCKRAIVDRRHALT